MRILCAFVTLLLASPAVLPAAAADTSTASVMVIVHVSARTSLRVSSHVLDFSVPGPQASATAAVEFSAGARVASDADLVLTVEPLGALSGPGGPADPRPEITFSGNGDGTASGTLALSGPTVAGQWRGSGLRQGRLLFTLRTSAAGQYELPLRFVLSTP